jgi:ABC-type transport system involved in cytochrome c biogenesis permease subunit
MAAALYLAAGVGALLGLALPARRIQIGARWGLALGALVQGVAFATLHRLDPAPSLTELGQAVAVMAWVSVIFLLFLMTRFRLPGFVPQTAFVAFVATFSATLARSAGLAGFFFLLEHKRLKRRRSPVRRIPLPSLEALDRVNRVALALGFSLLSLGVVTGSLWLDARGGSFFSGSLHETWTLIAWLIYFGLFMLRIVGRQGARQAAASALAGFAFLIFAVLGSGLAA